MGVWVDTYRYTHRIEALRKFPPTFVSFHSNLCYQQYPQTRRSNTSNRQLSVVSLDLVPAGNAARVGYKVAEALQAVRNGVLLQAVA